MLLRSVIRSRRRYHTALLEILEPRLLLDGFDDGWGDPLGGIDDGTGSQSTDAGPTDTGSSDTGYTDTGYTSDNSGTSDFTWPDYSCPLPGAADNAPPPPQAQPPRAPSNLTAQALTSSSAYLAWHDNSGDAEGFQIARAGSDGTWTVVATLGHGATQFTDSGLAPATNYSYSISAFNSTGYSDYSNTASVTTLTTSDLVGQFGHIPGGPLSAPLTFNDADGTAITLLVSGPGSGTLHHDAAGYEITLTGTTLASSLQITTLKTTTPGDDGRFELASLTVGNPTSGTDQTALGTLNAATTDLSGNFTITGLASQITLGNLTGPETLSIAKGLPSAATATPMNLTLGQVTDASLLSGLGIQNLTVTRWTADNSAQIAAPFLTTLAVTGSRATSTTTAIPGDFQPSLLLTGPASAKPLLGSATIAGGVAAETWDIHGKVGPIKIAGGTGTATAPFTITDATDLSTLTFGDVTSLQINASGNLTTLTAGNIARGTLTVGGTINQLNVQSWLAGAITSASLNQLNSTGAKATRSHPAVPGDFAANLTLTTASPPAPRGRPTLSSASIAGAVGTAAWNITGSIGTIRIAGSAGTTTAPFTLAANGTIGTLNLGDVTNASLTSGNIGSLTAQRWQAGSLAATRLASLTITGRRVGSAFATAGDLDADLTLTGPSATQPVLGHASIAGRITGGTWQIAGPITSITAQSAAHWSLTLADAAKPGNLGSLLLTDPTADSNALTINANAITTLTIRGNLLAFQLTLRQPDPSRLALSTLTIRGRLATTQIRSAGSLGTITVGLLDHSLIFAGVQPSVSTLPASAADFISPLASSLPTIRSITLTGLPSLPGGPVLINSSLAAGSINRATLPSRASAVVDADHSARFGFATRIGNVLHYTGPASTGNYIAGTSSLIM